MGKVMMSGVAPNMTVPTSGILASDISVGSIVKLMEGGVATEYLVVNQGIPSGSSLYDASCDGMWLLRKDVKDRRKWHSSDVNNYKNSTIHAWLNGDFFNLFGTIEQEFIKQVKIPYVNGNGQTGAVSSGTNGLTAKVFLLSGYEIGWTTSASSGLPIDGACVSYFNGTSVADSKRIAYMNGNALDWWTRSPNMSASDTQNVNRCYSEDGGLRTTNCTNQIGSRPALVLPSTAIFDETTMLLKGVA